MDIGRVLRALQALSYADAWATYHRPTKTKKDRKVIAKVGELRWMARNAEKHT